LNIVILNYHSQALEKEYQAEIEKLQKKLKWYTENQELLEKGAKKIKHRDDEIHKLKMRIEELQTEVRLYDWQHEKRGS